MKLFGRAITQEDLDNIATYMDDGIREELHSQLAPCSPDEFIGAYISRDTELLRILDRNFDFAQDAYFDLDTGERWTELELIGIYEQTPEVHEDYPTWESYLEHMLDMGRQGIGGLVED